MKNILLITGIALTSVVPGISFADTYRIDSNAGNSFINFQVQKDGYRWVLGRFNQFNGTLEYNTDQPEASVINFTLNTASVDTNNATRDAILKSSAILNSAKFPQATFTTTGYKVLTAQSGRLTGTLTMHGVERTISFPVEKNGQGKDTEGHELIDFQGMTMLHLNDFGIHYSLGSDSDNVMLKINIEGVKQTS